MSGMRRRDFVTLFAGVAAWPLAASAQQPAMPIVGYLNAGAPDYNPSYLPAFRQGLAQSGFVEGAERHYRHSLGGKSF
jgi:putative tryptophan/tyrosine transport system substrate-binding protein